ncbi:hypothetical protein M3D92_04395 [Micrococcus terreus]|uniref:hypothetical protein n=1 Tax=Micrococcus terreus TaxID=574650 RepID=UPI0021A26FBF|nr:hypothetical protein [Micrococcus terreus]MCT2088540.1 hypothetical protein [Micrococcus terreus]
MFFFPDNTVLINFALAREVGLLLELLRGQGQWTDAVHAECEKSADTGLYPALEDVFSAMPSPIMLSQKEVQDARALRQQMSGPADPEHKNWGEAQTITVIDQRFSGSCFLTDDFGATDSANGAGIQVFSTAQLFALAVNVGKVERDTARATLQWLVDEHRRGIRIEQFDAGVR